MAGRFAIPRARELDSNADPGSGWRLNFYTTGTQSRLDTYSDDALSVANANPVVADSAGRFGDIFLKGEDYKVVLTDASDVPIWTADPVRSPSPKSTVVLDKSTTYVVTTGDDGKLIAADATLGAFTITLPAAATAGDGFEISIIKVDSSANAVTVDGDSSETINGNTDITLASQFDAVVLRSDGTEWLATTAPVSTTTPLPTNYLTGLKLASNATDSDHDIDIAVGSARDEDDTVNLVLATAITKRIDAAWAVGDGNGGLDTGTVANDTTYYVHLIRRSDTGVVDALFSLSRTAPTMPTDYDQIRPIGELLTDGSANIVADTITSYGFTGILQTKYDENTDLTALTDVIPEDDTIPVKASEGTEILSTTITPLSATNRIRVSVSVPGAVSTAGGRGYAVIFNGTTAVAVFSQTGGGNAQMTVSGMVEFVAGGTSELTISVNAGPSSGTFQLNGTPSGPARLFGGASRATLLVTEIPA